MYTRGRMKRLLLLTYAFPPATSPGALRPGYIARYLRSFGWDVTVVTHSAETPPFEARTIAVAGVDDGLQQAARASYRSQPVDAWHRKALRAIKELLLFPDERVTWALPALRTCLQLARRERFDAIVSTALPSSMHVLAGVLSRMTGIPWIADYRDPWSRNPYFTWGPVRNAMHETVERFLLRRASAITTISEPIATTLRTLHRRDDVFVVPNAYDPADWDAIAQTQPASFDLCYTGTMYAGKRSPDLLFAALEKLRSEGYPSGSRAKVHFYGKGDSLIPETAARYGISESVHCHGNVPRAQAMQAQRNSAAVLIFLSMEPGTRHETGSKYLEYLGAGRPILAFGPEGSALRDVIERHRLGWFASRVEEAAEALRNAYDVFERRTQFQPDTSAFLTAQQLAQRFAGLLDAVSAPIHALSEDARTAETAS